MKSFMRMLIGLSVLLVASFCNNALGAAWSAIDTDAGIPGILAIYILGFCVWYLFSWVVTYAANLVGKYYMYVAKQDDKADAANSASIGVS